MLQQKQQYITYYTSSSIIIITVNNTITTDIVIKFIFWYPYYEIDISDLFILAEKDYLTTLSRRLKDFY
jgi:hypothetical protein